MLDASERILIAAQEGPQSAFLSSRADITIYGGSAGSGKSWALLLEALHYVTSNKLFSGVIFRRNSTNIRNPGSLWDQSLQLYGQIAGAEPAASPLEWRFNPNGGKVKFAHLEYDKTVYDWHGAQVPLICFDELTEFSSFQFWYLLSRNRSVSGVRPYMRATCNPDADSWVAELIEWWIDQESGFPIKERSGVIRWFMRVGDKLVWSSDPRDLKPELLGLPSHTPDGILIPYQPKSLTFIPAKIFDNRELMSKDPTYLASLLALPLVERERLFGGNWKIRPQRGMYFQRGWVEVVEALPAGLWFKRGWDLAATEKNESNDPDWTCSTKIGKSNEGVYYVVDHTRDRLNAGRVDDLLRNTASRDGQEVEQDIPQDPGQAGKSQALHHARILGGYPFRHSPETGDKETRFKPFSSQSYAGNVKVLRAPWNDVWFSQLEAFPESAHDDDVDSTSRSFNSFLDSSTGLLEYYEKAARDLEKEEAAKRNPVLDPKLAVLVKSPNPNTNMLYDLKGKPVFTDGDGLFQVEPKHAEFLLRSGFKIIPSQASK